ncbi:MAG: thiol-disulfide oxidoreductase family protein [Myxococcaceae bacterium]|nr:thiol-disulfide oxidoreductase family protein [Myxococcaceae bacterium]
MYAEPKQLVLFDGVCNFCNSSVLFIVDHDPKERFVFAALQSEAGVRALAEHGLGELPLSTLVLLEGGRYWLRSDAALHIAKGLRWPWPLLSYVLRLIPRFIRDAGYRYFAGHRYAWFGQSNQCRVPTPELRRRIVA